MGVLFANFIYHLGAKNTDLGGKTTNLLHDLAARVRALKALLISDPAGARRQLAAREMVTIQNLGLDAFRVHA